MPAQRSWRFSTDHSCLGSSIPLLLDRDQAPRLLLVDVPSGFSALVAPSVSNPDLIRYLAQSSIGGFLDFSVGTSSDLSANNELFLSSVYLINVSIGFSFLHKCDRTMLVNIRNGRNHRN